MEKALASFTAGHGIAATPPSRRALMAVALFVLYVLMDRLTYVFPARFGITPFNPEAALAIVMLMFCGLRYVPLVFLAAVAGEATLPLPASARPLVLIVINGAILTAGYACIAMLLKGRFRIRIDLDTQRDVLRLIGVTLACMLLCGVAYVGALVWFGIGPVDRYFVGARRFFIGYSVGILVAAPLLLMAFSEPRRAQFWAYLRSIEAWLQIAAIAACMSWVFSQEQRDHVQYFYVLFLPLIWTAARRGMVGAASALIVIQTGLLLLVYFSGYQPLSVFELQLLLITLAITGLLLAVSIDEQRRVTADFHESLKLAAAGEMAAAIAHEINQPLTALSNYATAGQLIAACAHPDRALLNDTMGKLMEESRRTSAVVRRLRDFFRAGATRLERMVMSDLTAKIVQSLRSKAETAHVTLEIRTSGDTPRVLVDPLQIEVVLRNLILNAIESAAAVSAQGGHVELHIQTNRAGEIVVAVRDNGSGIPEADSERLFDSFVTTKTSGMGMGLAISRAIVEAHGGRIWAVPGASGLLCFALPPEAPAHAAVAS